MLFLILVSLVWAVSFGLIGSQLTSLPPGFVAFTRLLLSFLVFLPFLHKAPWKPAVKLMGIGAVQFGLMYLTYIAAFGYMPSYQVALFTVLTPFYVVLIDDLVSRRLHYRHLTAALLVILGCLVIQWKGDGLANTSLTGFLILQISNFCFALGQWIYARINLPSSASRSHTAKNSFGYLYLGAVLILLPVAATDIAPALRAITSTQGAILLYLGIIASGLCFFLWNYGARQVSSARLAIMNNLKIPLAALSSILLFGEKANWSTLLPGLALVIVALALTKK